jgi:hypothetical protein
MNWVPQQKNGNFMLHNNNIPLPFLSNHVYSYNSGSGREKSCTLFCQHPKKRICFNQKVMPVSMFLAIKIMIMLYGCTSDIKHKSLQTPQ